MRASIARVQAMPKAELHKYKKFPVTASLAEAKHSDMGVTKKY